MAASKEGASLAANTTERGILATRVFDAPRDLVWKVWTEPEHIAKWGAQGIFGHDQEDGPETRRSMGTREARARWEEL